MADTRQPLPSWMTYSSDVFTAPGGGLTTSYTILQLPLTYYGPSIPLGPEWVYGGSTSPASTATPAPTTTSSSTFTPTTSSTATPSPTSTAIPTSTPSSISTATPITSTTTPISSTLTSSPTFTTSTSSDTTISSFTTTSASSPIFGSSAASSAPAATPTMTSDPQGNHGLSHNAIIAIICGSVAGFLILLVLLLLCCLLTRRNRRRAYNRGEEYRPSRLARAFPIPASLSSFGSFGSSYVILGQDRTGASDQRGAGARTGAHVPGEGSPRHSGEEHDPFLRVRGATSAAGAAVPRYDDNSSSNASGRSQGAIWAIGPDGQHILISSSNTQDNRYNEMDHEMYSDMDTTVVDVDEAARFRAFMQADQERVRVAAARHMVNPGAFAAFAAAGQDYKEKEPVIMDEKASADVRDSKSPLLPPRQLDPDGLGLGLLNLPRAASPYSNQGSLANSQSRSHAGSRGPRLSVDSGVSLLEPYTPAQVMFARRVHMTDPRVPSASSPPEAHAALQSLAVPAGLGAGQPQQPRSSWLPALSGNIGRLSGFDWLKAGTSGARPSSRPNSGAWISRTPSFRTASPLNPRSSTDDEDASVGLLAPGASSPPLPSEPQPAAVARPRSRLDVVASMERPVSTLSGRSHTSTVYLSAIESPTSSMSFGNRAVGASTPPPMPPLPAAATHQGSVSSPTLGTGPTYPQYGLNGPNDLPPAYTARDPAGSGLGSVDILDLPVPMPVPTFASSSSNSRNRVRRGPPPPLQLSGNQSHSIPQPRVWMDLAISSADATPLSPIASVSIPESEAGSTLANSAGPSPNLDILDAEPPRAADVWRSLADARQRGARAPTALPMLVQPLEMDRRQSYNVSVHGSGSQGSHPANTGSTSSRATTGPPYSPLASTMETNSVTAPPSTASIAPPLSAFGITYPIPEMPEVPSTPQEVRPLQFRRDVPRVPVPAMPPHVRGLSLTRATSSHFGTQDSDRASSGDSAGGSEYERGVEGAASLTAFGPPQPGAFMSRNPFAPMTMGAHQQTSSAFVMSQTSTSSIRIVQSTRPSGDEWRSS